MPTPRTMFEKIWSRHVIAEEEGELLLYVIEPTSTRDRRTHSRRSTRATGKSRGRGKFSRMPTTTCLPARAKAG
jgi:hypothetical protein